MFFQPETCDVITNCIQKLSACSGQVQNSEADQKKLDFIIHDEADDHESDDGDQVVQEGVVVGDVKGHRKCSHQH